MQMRNRISDRTHPIRLGLLSAGQTVKHVSLATILQQTPPCPRCGRRMVLARNPPCAPGEVQATVECLQCDHTQSFST